MREVFARCYPLYDPLGTEKWFRDLVMPFADVHQLNRTEDAFCLSTLVEYSWIPGIRECHVIALCADAGKVWQAVALLRTSIAWASFMGAAAWRFQADTGIDIGPMMRRLGIRQDSARYRIDLGGSNGKNGHY